MSKKRKPYKMDRDTAEALAWILGLNLEPRSQRSRDDQSGSEATDAAQVGGKVPGRNK